MYSLSDVFLTATLPTGYKRTGPPLGIGYIASALAQSGFSVSLLDPSPMDMSEDQVVDAVVREEPLITGIYCCTMDRYQAFSLATRIKNRLPETNITMGGPHVSFVAEKTLQHVHSVDIIVRGEGEVTMTELTRSLSSSSPLSKVDGISYRQGNEIRSNPPRQPIQDLDSLPFPAYDLFPDLSLYAPLGIVGSRRSSIVMTTRGCPFKCSFCSSNPFWVKARARSPENVANELEYLVHEHGVEFIKFYDDVFTLNKKRTEKICQEIVNRKLDIGFFILTRADTVDHETIQNLRDAGCEQIQFGLESGSQRIINKIQKGIDLHTAEKAFGMTRKAGIETYVFLMLGLKGETESDIQETIDFVINNADDITTMETSINAIYPGSPDYYECLKKGLIDENIWFNYRNDDPLLYKDTPPYPSEIPLRRLKAYRRLVYLIKTGLRRSSLSKTSLATAGFVGNHLFHPEDLVMLGDYIKKTLALRKRMKESGQN